MRPYIALAGAYDGLTADVPYGAFADFYEAVFKSLGVSPRTVLDLACGTGTLTRLLAGRGYELIGVDASPEMLAVALEKTLDCDVRPLLLCQRMEELDLYGTVDAAVCSLDGLNYLPGELLPEVFRRLRLFIEPGGVLIFDVLTPEALRALDGQLFVDENEDAYCVWRAEYDAEENACFYGMDIFERSGALWRRSAEEHVEYAHGTEALVSALREQGFEDIRAYGGLALRPPESGDGRVFIAAVRPRV